MGSTGEVRGTEPCGGAGSDALPAAEAGGTPSTQGIQLGGSCCLTHLQAAGGHWDAAGRPQGAASRANFSSCSINHGAGGNHSITASPAFASASASSPGCPVFTTEGAWRSRGQGLPPFCVFGPRN